MGRERLNKGDTYTIKYTDGTIVHYVYHPHYDGTIYKDEQHRDWSRIDFIDPSLSMEEALKEYGDILTDYQKELLKDHLKD